VIRGCPPVRRIVASGHTPYGWTGRPRSVPRQPACTFAKCAPIEIREHSISRPHRRIFGRSTRSWTVRRFPRRLPLFGVAPGRIAEYVWGSTRLGTLPGDVFPIPDPGVADGCRGVWRAAPRGAALRSGEPVVVHCAAGIGRLGWRPVHSHCRGIPPTLRVSWSSAGVVRNICAGGFISAFPTPTTGVGTPAQSRRALI